MSNTEHLIATRARVRALVLKHHAATDPAERQRIVTEQLMPALDEMMRTANGVASEIEWGVA